MKPCYYCKGRKVRYYRDPELRIIVQCAKCGAKVHTPYVLEDGANGYWNTKQVALEHCAKAENKAAAE